MALHLFLWICQPTLYPSLFWIRAIFISLQRRRHKSTILRRILSWIMMVDYSWNFLCRHLRHQFFFLDSTHQSVSQHPGFPETPFTSVASQSSLPPPLDSRRQSVLPPRGYPAAPHSFQHPGTQSLQQSVPPPHGYPATPFSSLPYPVCRPPPGFAPLPSMQYPKIIFFSGDNKDASYQQWRNEVKCLIREGHPPSNIMQGIRRSLKGTAADVLINLGENVTPDRVIAKFDVIFGVALTSEALLEEYYTARQKEDEAAAVWGCRLETILGKVQRRGHISSNAQEMLRTKFWSGLKDERVKSALRHKFDANYDFEALLRAARSVELEMVHKSSPLDTPKPKPNTTAKVTVQQTSPLDSRLDDLMKEIAGIKAELRELKQRPPVPSTPVAPPAASDEKAKIRAQLWQSGSCFYCREQGHFIADCPNKKPKQEQDTVASTSSGNGV